MDDGVKAALRSWALSKKKRTIILWVTDMVNEHGHIIFSVNGGKKNEEDRDSRDGLTQVQSARGASQGRG